MKDALFYQEYEDDCKKKKEFDEKIFSYLKTKIERNSAMIKFIQWGDFYYNIIADKNVIVSVIEPEDIMLEKVIDEMFSIIGEIKDGLIIVIEGNGLYFEDNYVLRFGYKYV